MTESGAIITTIELSGSQVKKITKRHVTPKGLVVEEWLRAVGKVAYSRGLAQAGAAIKLDGRQDVTEIEGIKDEDARWAFGLQITGVFELQQRFPTATFVQETG